MLSRSSGTVTKSEGTRFLVMISFMTATARCVFHRATEVQTSPTLLIGFPAHDVVHDLGESLLRIPAKSGIEVVERVAFHALAETAAVPEGRDPRVAAHQLPLAPFVLLFALRGAGMVVPLPRLAVLLLKGGRELVPLGLELASAVGADLIVEPQYLGPGIALTPSPRRATHSPPGVWQQTVYPVHHSPPLQLHVSSRRLPSRPRSARRA